MYLEQTTPNPLITVLPTKLDNLDQFLWIEVAESTVSQPGVKKIPVAAIAQFCGFNFYWQFKSGLKIAKISKLID